MKTRITFIMAAAIAVSGEAPPPRATGLDIPTAQSIQILAACVEKKLGQFTEEDLPKGGISIRYGESRSLFIHTKPTLYFDITDQGDARHIVIQYRHPMSKGTAAKTLRIIGRKCFPYELDAAGGGVLPDTGA
jgi:hypothetical protein